VGELVALAWVALALALFVPLWGIYGAAVALSSSYVLSLTLLVVIAGRHHELEWAGRSLLALPRDVMQAVKRSGRGPELALAETDRPAGIS
jgi:hypothetical protein